MHSADYAVAKCLSVRVSVCPSHADILSKRLNISSNFFHIRVASHTILVFPHQTVCQHYDGALPPNGSVKCTGYDLAKYSVTRSVARSLCDS